MDNCASGIGIFMTIILISFYTCNTWISYYSPRPRVKVLVRQPKGEEFSFAKLSPKRDKLFYRLSDRTDFVLDLVTGEIDQLQNKCNVWLDNETLVCGNKEAFYLLDVRYFSRTSIEPVNGEQQSYAKFIKDEDQIYRYSYQISPSRSGSESLVFIKSTRDHWSYLFNIKDRSQFESDVSMIPVPYIQDSPHISPNGKYYLQTSNDSKCLTPYLEIYEKISDQKHFVSGNCVHSEYDIVGWTYDSSGVIYVTFKGYVGFHPHHIYKLNVSLKEGLIRLARNSLIGLILLLGIFYLFRQRRRLWHWPQNRLLLVLVPQSPNDQFSVVTLSPEGDKLAYVLSSAKAFILDLVTGKTHWLSKKCEQQTWLDNQTLLCHNGQEAFKVDVRNLLSISISQVDAKKEELPDLDTHTHLTSPNGKYYYTYSTTEGLRILTTQDKQLVRKLTFACAALPNTDNWAPNISQVQSQELSDGNLRLSVIVQDDKDSIGQRVKEVSVTIYSPGYSPPSQSNELVQEEQYLEHPPVIMRATNANHLYEALLPSTALDERGSYRIVMHAIDEQGSTAQPKVIDFHHIEIYLPLLLIP